MFKKKSQKDQWRVYDIYPHKSMHYNIKPKKSFWHTNSRLGGLVKGGLTGLTVLISVLIIFTIVQAGSLTPSASPAATGYTLSDIYTRLTTNATSNAGDHIFSPAAPPASTLFTLTQIYDAIPTINAARVLTGTSYLGITGTAYGDTDAAKVLTTAAVAGTYNASNLTVGTVKSGTTFGVNLTGAYPSTTYPLPNATVTTDLAGDGTNITSSNGAVEWWRSDGTQQTATLDFPTLSNVCSSDTSNNSTGTLSVTAAYISVGNTYCGTAGTLLANLFNGTGQWIGIIGGSQANGGVDDWNTSGAAPSDRYSKGWTACTSANNYCNTGLSSADAKDDSTGLIWSMPCYGVGCASFSDVDWPLFYTWDSSGVNNNAQTAPQLCSAGSHGQTGWFLPHQKQLMQAYINGSYGNLEATGVQRYYWSGTTLSWNPAAAWYTNLSRGLTTPIMKTSASHVRCVRQP